MKVEAGSLVGVGRSLDSGVCVALFGKAGGVLVRHVLSGFLC